MIGNSNYGGDLGILPNPVNDAALMAKTLQAVGFSVIEAEDADQNAMKHAISDFGEKLANAGTGATGLFFYAGHGLQVSGTNYLIPVHANIKREPDVDIEAVPELTDVTLSWYVGLDADGSRIGDMLWRGEEIDEAALGRVIGLFRLGFRDPSVMLDKVKGEPVYMILAMTPDKIIRMKPQNLIAGLPIRHLETVA